MLGVVLCGGQSTRMGVDKGMLEHQSVTWAEHAYTKLASLELRVVLSINKQQYPGYNQTFERAVLVTDDDALQIGGPLKGLLSAHLRHPNEDLLVLACDMRDMNTEVLQHLIEACSGKHAEAYVFQNAEIIEPLCAIYTSNGLKKVYKYYRQGELRRHSLQHVLSLLDTHFLPVSKEWKKCFINFNSPEDLSAV